MCEFVPVAYFINTFLQSRRAVVTLQQITWFLFLFSYDVLAYLVFVYLQTKFIPSHRIVCSPWPKFQLRWLLVERLFADFKYHHDHDLPTSDHWWTDGLSHFLPEISISCPSHPLLSRATVATTSLQRTGGIPTFPSRYLYPLSVSSTSLLRHGCNNVHRVVFPQFLIWRLVAIV